MKYLLDTNVCVDYLTGRYPSVMSRIQDSSPHDLYLSTIVIAELRYGAAKSARRRRNHKWLDILIDEIPSVDFDTRAASTYGTIRSMLEKTGELIGPNDMLIAAHALSLSVVLVTDNIREFRRVRGLRVEDWR